MAQYILESLKVDAEEILEEMMAPKFPNYENCKSIDANSVNNSHKKHEVNSMKHIHHQVAHQFSSVQLLSRV